jgi:hypothetical protein
VLSYQGIRVYRSRIDSIDEMRRQLEEKVSRLEFKGSEIAQTIKNHETRSAELERSAKQLQEALHSIFNEETGLMSQYKVVASNVSVLVHASEIQNAASPRRLAHLQELGQMIHPVGVAPMLEILLDKSEREEMRLNAAYGLGRYSENKDTSEYWAQILEAFKRLVKDPTTPDAVITSALLASAKYGLVLERSREVAVSDAPAEVRGSVEKAQENM